jgi:hypothetical protein
MKLSRPARHIGAALAIATTALMGTGCVGPFGPCTEGGPIVGNLRPDVVGGVPEPTASILTRQVCTPMSVQITVTVEHNEHPVEVVLDHNYPTVTDLTEQVAPGGGVVQFQSREESWRVRITHLDLGGTEDDLDYRIEWALAPQ